MAIIVCNDFKTFAVYFGYLTKTRFKCCHKFYEVLSCSDRPTPYIFSIGHNRNISKLVIKLSNLFSIYPRGARQLLYENECQKILNICYKL